MAGEGEAGGGLAQGGGKGFRPPRLPIPGRGSIEEGGEGQATGDLGEGLAVAAAREGFEGEGVEDGRGAAGGGPVGRARGLGAQAIEAEPFERGGGGGAGGGGDAGRREAGKGRGGGGRGDGEGDGAAAGVGGCEGGAVVLLDDVEDDAGVGRVVVVAVGAPAAGAQVELDIAAELGAIELDDGVAGIGTVAGGGDAGEADAEAASVLDAGEGAEAGEPALGEGGLAAGGGVDGGLLGERAPGGGTGGDDDTHGASPSPGASSSSGGEAS